VKGVGVVVAGLFVLGASPALLLEMRRPPDVPRRAEAPSLPWGTLSVAAVAQTCSLDGKTWFRSRADGCHAEDAPMPGRCDALTVLSIQSGTAVIGPYSTNLDGAASKISISVESGTSLEGPLTIEDCDGTVTIHADAIGGPR
jgi:hypothetical protein